MNTPLQELLRLESDLTDMFDSDQRVAIVLLEYIRANKNEMLYIEKEQMIDFAYKCRNLMAADEFAITKWYDKTFKTNENRRNT
jgi:hypothetical protein